MNMKIKRKFAGSLIVLSAFLITGCVSTKLPEAYQVDPEVLELKGGQVEFTVTGTIPPKSFHRKAKVEFSPFLKYDEETKPLSTFMLRGEKTEGEGTVVNTKTGGSFTYSETFDYMDDYRVSELMVNARIMKGKRSDEYTDIKLADGIIVTAQSIVHDEQSIEAASGYERETIITELATIYFRQNMANLDWNIKHNRADEAKNNLAKVDEFLLKGWTIRDITLDGWASPEGEIDFNDNLSVNRAATAKRFMENKVKSSTEKRARELKVRPETLKQEVKYIEKGHGEDWNGFMTAVQNSDMGDKNTIINVVNSQPDLTKREQEIRNMTVIYKEIEEEILPPLRRAEIAVNCYEPKRTDEEIAQLAVTYPDSLTYKELLHAATLTPDHQARYNIYRSGFTHAGRDWRAYNNAAVEAIAMNMLDEAESHLVQAEGLDPQNGLIENNKGVIASKRKDFITAETHFLNAQKYGEDASYNLGLIAIQKGDYQKAIALLKSAECNHNTALAQMLAKELDAALKNLQCAPENPKTYYILAVYGARTNNGEMVYANLAKAFEHDISLKEKAKEDREFLKYFDQEAFKTLIN
jgi:tetratricopeptide (TPR) repeat protein/outer membrane protein OmpA-like peptidoglycan-associated protein